MGNPYLSPVSSYIIISKLDPNQSLASDRWNPEGTYEENRLRKIPLDSLPRELLPPGSGSAGRISEYSHHQLRESPVHEVEAGNPCVGFPGLNDIQICWHICRLEVWHGDVSPRAFVPVHPWGSLRYHASSIGCAVQSGCSPVTPMTPTRPFLPSTQTFYVRPGGPLFRGHGPQR